MANLNDGITVCAECLQASCWQGIFMCHESKHADVIKKTKRELISLGYENQCYMKTDDELFA